MNAAGEGDPIFSEMWIPLGRPDAVPYTESFAGGMLEHIFRTKIETGTGMWSMGDDDTQPGLQSADGDNGFIICNGGEAGDVGALYSGRIDLGMLPNPQLSFNYFNYGSDDTGFITVMVNSGEGFEPLGQPVLTGEGDEGAWNLAVFPMAEYAGKKIELAFKATMSDYKTVAIDNISIASQRGHDLSGSRNDGGITLAWQAPDLTDGPRMQITDTFEDYGSFATWMAGDWTFVDMDKAAVDGPSDFDIPNVTAGQPASFFIMDTSGEDFTTYGFNAYSGDKVLAAQLPDGAQYLAIRYISSDAFILMVDDVTFATPDCETVNYEIEGYNIYRDRTLVGSVPAGEHTYIDADAPEGTYLYHVTALYAGKGESDPSVPVTVGDSSIDTIGAATRHIGAKGAQGHITVTGAEGLAVSVWGADGRLVAKTTGSETTEIAAGNGIYVVDVQGHRIKVAVR